MARLINKRDVNLYVEELVKTENHGYSPLKIIRNLKGVDTAKLKIYPVTIVNLLGKYGNFETDTNGDGLADTWQQTGGSINPTYSLVSGIIGSYAQRVENNDVAGGGVQMGKTPSTTPIINVGDNVFFAKVYLRTNSTNGVLARVNFFDSSQVYLNSVDSEIITTTSWTTAIVTATAPTNTYYLTIHWQTNIEFDLNSYFDADGYMIVNLTDMGTLPPPLKKYFDNQVSYWADLATTSNITAVDGRTQTGEAWLNELIQYVDSVASLGFAWGDVG